MSAMTDPTTSVEGRRLAIVTVALVAAAVVVDALAIALQGRASTLGIPTFLMLNLVRALVVGVLALVAAVTGLIGMRPRTRTPLTAAGLGGAAVILVGVLSGLILPPLSSLVDDLL